MPPLQAVGVWGYGSRPRHWGRRCRWRRCGWCRSLWDHLGTVTVAALPAAMVIADRGASLCTGTPPAGAPPTPAATAFGRSHPDESPVPDLVRRVERPCRPTTSGRRGSASGGGGCRRRVHPRVVKRGRPCSGRRVRAEGHAARHSYDDAECNRGRHAGGPRQLVGTPKRGEGRGGTTTRLALRGKRVGVRCCGNRQCHSGQSQSPWQARRRTQGKG